MGFFKMAILRMEDLFHIHYYHSRFISEGLAETLQIYLGNTYILLK
jgi:hypothetical protein